MSLVVSVCACVNVSRSLFIQCVGASFNWGNWQSSIVLLYWSSIEGLSTIMVYSNALMFYMNVVFF